MLKIVCFYLIFFKLQQPNERNVLPSVGELAKSARSRDRESVVASAFWRNLLRVFSLRGHRSPIEVGPHRNKNVSDVYISKTYISTIYPVTGFQF